MKKTKRLLFILLAAVFCASDADASSSLFYFEAQGITGYSSHENRVQYHSGHKHDTMQKNGIGFDLVRRFSTEYGDFGVGALQMRLVWDNNHNEPQVQFYNAYFRLKTSLADIWIGHNRISFGLASYWDTHAHLLQPLPMSGLGFEHDWGAGISRDFANGDFSAAVTTGSGMGIRTRGNRLATARASFGVLARDNYNIGVSFMGGKKLDTMGYEVMDDTPKNTLLGGVDFAYNHGRVEHRADLVFGQKNEMAATAVFYRLGYNLMEDNRLKLEGQYVWTKLEGADANALGFGATYRIRYDLTARAMYQWEREMCDNRIVFQLYYYRLLRR